MRQQAHGCASPGAAAGAASAIGLDLCSAVRSFAGGSLSRPLGDSATFAISGLLFFLFDFGLLLLQARPSQSVRLWRCLTRHRW